jgi:hypothetical protein
MPADERNERKAAHIAVALEAVRRAWAVKKDGKQLRPKSALAKKAALKRISWPIRWDTPGAT